jgi:5-methylcytosine-specific restriction endonuclease McrA
MARDGHRCGYCGGVATTVDHILPRARGGKKEATV